MTNKEIGEERRKRSTKTKLKRVRQKTHDSAEDKRETNQSLQSHQPGLTFNTLQP